MERQQEAGARDAPLGEDADDLAVLEGVGGGVQRLDDGARAGAAVDGNDLASRSSTRSSGTRVNGAQITKRTDRRCAVNRSSASMKLT